MGVTGTIFDRIVQAIGGLPDPDDHIGRYNRSVKKIASLYAEADLSADRREIYLQLFNHDCPDVRSWSAWHCGWAGFLFEDAERTMKQLACIPEYRDAFDQWHKRKPDMQKGASLPPQAAGSSQPAELPEPVSYDQAAKIIFRYFPGMRGEQLCCLLKPSLRIITTPYSGDERGSRFGGLPLLPPGRSWITVEDEPLLFLAQINFADIHSVFDSCGLPEQGLLLFFGDHDEVHGCGPNLGHRIVHIPSEIFARLRMAKFPDAEFEPHPMCGLRFQKTHELPDPKSLMVRNLELIPEEQKLYRQLVNEIERRHEYDCDCSKLFGWPHLLQCDLAEDGFTDVEEGDVLLLQIGSYHNGSDWQGWGPGGLVYFTIDPDSLASGTFENIKMSVQCT